MLLLKITCFYLEHHSSLAGKTWGCVEQQDLHWKTEKLIKTISKKIIFFWENEACASVSRFQTTANREKQPFKKPLCFATAVPAQGAQVATDTSFGFLMTQLVMLINSES